jgi:hypothetical protein
MKTKFRKIMSKLGAILISTFTLLNLQAKPHHTPNFTVQSYVSKYRLIAQLESHRSGIPASIILAQAILESGYGNSNLCTRSNNHFGIKWKNSNDGDFVYSLDDDYDQNGKHIPSKFISYENDILSFQHHTDFLMNRANYKSLFRFDCSNYTNWAYGLRACGYSTDDTYGTQLIILIKRYDLNFYDLPKALNAQNNNPVEDTKSLVNIFTGKKLNWSILLKPQSSVLEETNLAIANEPKIQSSMVNSFKKPLPLSSSIYAHLEQDALIYDRNRFAIN